MISLDEIFDCTSAALVMPVRSCDLATCTAPAMQDPLESLVGAACRFCRGRFCPWHYHDPRAHWCNFADQVELQSKEFDVIWREVRPVDVQVCD